MLGLKSLEKTRTSMHSNIQQTFCPEKDRRWPSVAWLLQDNLKIKQFPWTDHAKRENSSQGSTSAPTLDMCVVQVGGVLHAHLLMPVFKEGEFGNTLFCLIRLASSQTCRSTQTPCHQPHLGSISVATCTH